MSPDESKSSATRPWLSPTRTWPASIICCSRPPTISSSAGSHMTAPFVDVNLRSTNGLLTITNLLAASISKNEGTIDLYAARWTNVFVDRTHCGGPATITNHYHVLFVNANLSPISPTRAQDFILHTI